MNPLRAYLARYAAEDMYAKVQLGLTVLIQAVLLGAFIVALFQAAWLIAFVSASAMFVIWLPLFFARQKRVHIPIEFEFILAVFVFGSLFLGEVHGFYARLWWWDLLLHGIAGIALGFIGFLILYVLHRSGRFSAGPGLLSLFSFTFAMSLGALWEIAEFVLDIFLGLNTQKSGLIDTMSDLIVDALGATLMAVSGYFYMRYKKRGAGILEYYLTAYFRRNKERVGERRRQ
jgi:hypothetical protein